MPKMKTDKTVAKRFRTSANGKLMHAQRNKRHILTKKTSKRKRHLGKEVALDHTAQVKYVKSVLDH
jgi:large subunit ribosomal protein L35